MIADSSQADNSKAFLNEMESAIGFQVRKKRQCFDVIDSVFKKYFI